MTATKIRMPITTEAISSPHDQRTSRRALSGSEPTWPRAMPAVMAPPMDGSAAKQVLTTTSTLITSETIACVRSDDCSGVSGCW